jgi:hypothetical protein
MARLIIFGAPFGGILQNNLTFILGDLQLQLRGLLFFGCFSLVFIEILTFKAAWVVPPYLSLPCKYGVREQAGVARHLGPSSADKLNITVVFKEFKK